jgi:hypothetical protein
MLETFGLGAILGTAAVLRGWPPLLRLTLYLFVFHAVWLAGGFAGWPVVCVLALGACLAALLIRRRLRARRDAAQTAGV